MLSLKDKWVEYLLATPWSGGSEWAAIRLAFYAGARAALALGNDDNAKGLPEEQFDAYMDTLEEEANNP